MLEEKEKKLIEILKSYKNIIVAYSGGTDSNYLLYAAKKSGANVRAVTFVSNLYPKSETQRAVKNAEEFNARHSLIEVSPLEIDEIRNNRPERCYVCKKFLFSKLIDMSKDLGGFVVIDGSNVDDLSDYRPGRKATQELGVKSPLIEAQLKKDEIRELSERANLNTWNIPSFACYLSRFEYDKYVSDEELLMVSQAEQTLHEMGAASVRVRFHKGLARLEANKDDFEKYFCDETNRLEIVKKIKKLGFTYITIDLEGYKSGSMNKTIGLNK